MSNDYIVRHPGWFRTMDAKSAEVHGRFPSKKEAKDAASKIASHTYDKSDAKKLEIKEIPKGHPLKGNPFKEGIRNNVNRVSSEPSKEELATHKSGYWNNKGNHLVPFNQGFSKGYDKDKSNKPMKEHEQDHWGKGK